jgi:EmrB/QacA subfamily drug resistance transporter
VAEPVAEPVTYASRQGRWVLVAAVLGSGIAFLDGTVVNTALPAIARDFDAGIDALQWTLTAYLLTQGSLLVLGGSLGDLYGRKRVFIYGLVGFAVASLACAVAQNSGQLIAARGLQGVAAAALVPGSLALLSSVFRVEDRGRAIGAWSGLAGISTAIGPFLGGWLIDSVSWRLVFLINVPLVAVAVAIATRWVPETRDDEEGVHLDLLGAATLSIGLGGVVYALIEGPAGASTGVVAAAAVLGIVSLIVFVFVEARVDSPMVPLTLFRSRQFSGANAVTVVVYAALGIAMFLVVVHLQTNLGYSALEAGAALLPLTVIMLAFSARSGALAQRIGPRLQMSVGPLIVAAGLLILASIDRGSTYVTGVLPGILVLGAGLATTVAPLTAAVLAAVDDHHMGVGSAINNAASRIATLMAIAVIPGVAGLADDFGAGYQRSLVIAAVLAAAGGVIGWLTIRRAVPVQPTRHVAVGPPCHGRDTRDTRQPEPSLAS